MDEDNTTLELTAWTILLLTVLYIGGHFVKAHAWDGFIDLAPAPSISGDVEVNTGTRETVETTGLVIPGGEIQVTDSEGDVHNLEVIVVNPDTGGPVQIEAYDEETNEFYDLEMNIR